MLVTEINPNDELWLSKVEAPQIITDANLFAWDDEADLVVAGLGGAGIAAANEELIKQMAVVQQLKVVVCIMQAAELLSK